MSSEALSEKLEVRVGEDQCIIPLHKNRGPLVHMIKLGNGDIVVNTIYLYGATVPGRRSRDGGQTWEEATCTRSKDDGKTWNKGNLEIGDRAFEFSDGEAVMFYGDIGKETEKEGVYTFPFRRCTNYGANQLDEEATVVLPQRAATIMTLPPSLKESQKEPAPDLDPSRSIIQLRDGSLIASVQGHFCYDPSLATLGRLGGWRVFVVRSTDRGRTWNYLSTVATDFDAKNEDGFCEPVLLTIPNGDILCIMRTGGLVTDVSDPKVKVLSESKLVIPEGDLRFVCDPMHLSVSKDDGLSWSAALPIIDFGVYPKAVLMENGIIALTYGRPDNWMAFSADYGKTWINHIKVNDAPESIDAGHYNSIVEVEPGKLLLGYAQGDPKVKSRAPVDHTHSEIRGTFIYVKRLDK